MEIVNSVGPGSSRMAGSGTSLMRWAARREAGFFTSSDATGLVSRSPSLARIIPLASAGLCATPKPTNRIAVERKNVFVSAQEADRAFQHYTNSAGAQLGSTVRVIVIDRHDCFVRERKFEQGITDSTTSFRHDPSSPLSKGGGTEFCGLLPTRVIE
jgi:hypothetical protein